ncbi:hypothetical protein [Roseicella aquatilis]|uniref:VWA domain-containing protein n=1 Tax=Roseicella aquatilis TaxID=2527868 RepID=A0A4R4D4L7_9PROT|nr:hypothetical protein [Roseicella aquatilis]TCZ51791.1 hypothetical protein EXY23_26710 [Roseicella aquatilis]
MAARPRRRLGAALLLALPALARPAAAAETDYCAIGDRTSLLLVDRTTRYDAVDRDILVRSVDAFFRRQDPGERLVVAAASGAYTELKLVFNACRPGCPEAGFLGRLTSACRPVLARADFQAFEAEFLARLVELLKQPEEAAASDLFRSVAEATRLVGANGYAPLRQVLIFSDLLEASSLFPGQAIRRTPPAEALRRLSEAHVAARLAGAEVRVIGFGRSDAPNRPPLPQDIRRRVEESWEGWFRAGGARSVQIGLR